MTTGTSDVASDATEDPRASFRVDTLPRGLRAMTPVERRPVSRSDPPFILRLSRSPPRLRRRLWPTLRFERRLEANIARGCATSAALARRERILEPRHRLTLR